MENVYLLWITEGDCDGENTYLDGVFSSEIKANQRLATGNFENIVSNEIEERKVV